VVDAFEPGIVAQSSVGSRLTSVACWNAIV
jgi:hypothetical protein